MLTFILCIAALVVGYIFYGKRVDKIFGSDDRETPAIALNDGVDFVPMKGWKIFLVQLLNIAGLGPIFGALNGALFGPVVYLWIVFGTIFAGGVHDYMCGMLSMRHKGASISEITGTYLGKVMLQVMRVFSVILLVMVGVVFSKGPAGLLALLTPEKLDATFWLWVIIIYYFIATFVPIDKVIGKIYPIFGICLGHQLSALAAGAKTMKLKYGHRGANQPAKDVKTGLSYMTSQNHGYAVDCDTLPENASLRFVNGNDGTCEGVDYTDMPAFSVQFHPEACGGPLDTRFLFDRFIAMMGGNKECR